METETILLLMENTVELRLIRMALTLEKYSVRTATSAEQSSLSFDRDRPHLILVDLASPGNALETVRRIRQDPRADGVKVVALAPSAAPECRESALDAGCDDVISRPIETAKLVTAIRECLGTLSDRTPVPIRHLESKTSLQPVPKGIVGMSDADIDDYRDRFLIEGLERSRRLLNTAPGALDTIRAAMYLHQWASVSPQLGCPEIATLAASGLRLLGSDPIDFRSLHEVLTALLLTFAQLQDKRLRDSRRVLADMTSGKRVALIGFSPRQADDMCLLLKKLKVVALRFEASDSFDSPAIANCDMAIVQVHQQTLASGWLEAERVASIPVKFILTGSQRDLVALSPEVRTRAVDVLLDREDSEAFQLRLAFALSDPRPHAAGPLPFTARPALPPPERLAVSSPTVLLADDDDICVSLTSAILRNNGMSCIAVNNGVEALNAIRREQPHAAVLDVRMPGMNGFEILAEIRRERLPVRVILLTACQQEENVLKGFQLGADDYVVKPFNTFELAARVKRFLQ